MDFLGGVANSGKTFVVNTGQGIWNIGSEVVGTGYGMLQWASDGPTALIHGILPGEQNAKYARFHGQRFMSGLSTAGAVVDGIHSETIQLGMSVLEGDIEDVFQRANSAAVSMTGGLDVTSEERALRTVLILSAFKKPPLNSARSPVVAPVNLKAPNVPTYKPFNAFDDFLNYNTSLSARAGSADLIPDYLLRKKPVRPFEVGTADDLWSRSVRGDGLDIHHVGQAHPLEQIITGYDRSKGPAISIPRRQHSRIPTVRGSYTGTARSQLAKDIWDLRNYTDAMNGVLKELIELNKKLFPEAYNK